MKDFRIVLAVLVAAFTGGGFTSCDKVGGDEASAKEKKLVKFVYGGSESTFKYDAQGRLIQMLGKSPASGLNEEYTYVWGENTVDITLKMKIEGDGTGEELVETGTLNLKDGLATRISGDGMLLGRTAFTYDASDRLTGFVGFVSAISLTWDGDKMMSMRDAALTGSLSVLTYTYEPDIMTKGHNPLIALELTTNYLFMAHPELAGISSQYLPSGRVRKDVMTDSQYTWISDYTYEFDKDGYVTKIIDTCEINGEDAGDTVYALTWE